MTILLRNVAFDPAKEQKAFQESATKLGAGAAVDFIGWVRNDGGDLKALEIEHYSEMAQSALENIEMQARAKWDVLDVLIIHRYGRLFPHEAIVLVAVSSLHRCNSFAAVEFMMDYLKSTAPFWKKAIYETREEWIVQKDSDVQTLSRWQ